MGDMECSMRKNKEAWVGEQRRAELIFKVKQSFHNMRDKWSLQLMIVTPHTQTFRLNDVV